MEHLLRNGNADNRYLIYGYVTSSQELHMQDAIVFAVRRLICPLDERWPPSREPEAPTFTNRELLVRQPEYFGRLFMPLDDLIGAREESPKRAAALNLNMAFAPDDYQHEPLRSGSSSRNPVIIRRILDPLESEETLGGQRKVSRLPAGSSPTYRCRKVSRTIPASRNRLWPP